MSETSKVVLILILLGVFIVSPLVTIWSLNTLFSLTIPYTVATWFATVWLSLVTFGNVVSAVRNKNGS